MPSGDGCGPPFGNFRAGDPRLMFSSSNEQALDLVESGSAARPSVADPAPRIEGSGLPGPSDDARALAQDRAILQEVVTRSPAATLVVWGPDQRVRLMNGRWLEVFPREPGFTGAGRPLADALPEVAAVLTPFLRRVAATGEPFRGVDVPFPAGGAADRFRYFTLTVSPVGGGSAEPEGILVVALETTDEVRRRRQLERELAAEQSIADVLQRSLLPELPHIPGLAMAARYVPGATDAGVGGDWYDVIPLSADRVGFAIGDVAGHGLRAASTMGQLRHALRAYAVEGHAPAAIMRRLDRLLEPQQQIATLLYGELDVATRRFLYANAGHPAALVTPAAGASCYLTAARHTPIGTGLTRAYEETAVTLDPRFTLVFFTDGLVEQRDRSIQVGLDRLRAASADRCDVETFCDRILESVRSRASPLDDVALLVVRDQPLSRESVRLTLPANPDGLDHVRSTLRLWLRDRGASEEETYELVTACGEACMNTVVHAYGIGPGILQLEAECRGPEVTIAVRDRGRWRAARDGAGGFGFPIMRAMTDDLLRRSTEHGTEIVLRRRLAARAEGGVDD
jgi:serine phosphatase RsbU (regulator of sigma subunit)/anti-sigma regulatory factor (Ser/Thr protein kinase)